MKRWSTSNGISIYRVLFGRCNCYLIPLKSTLILVDTGKRLGYRRLLRRIAKVSNSLQADGYLILTHTHFDHCQNAKRLSDEQGYRIILGNAEEGFALHGFSSAPKGTNRFSRFIYFLGNRCFRYKLKFKHFRPELLVLDEMVLNVEDANIRVISTPGHSVGSISVIVDNEIAIVGDALFGIFSNSVFPPFADDVKTLMASWAKLLKTNCTLFLPAHGRPITRELLECEYNKMHSL